MQNYLLKKKPKCEVHDTYKYHIPLREIEYTLDGEKKKAYGYMWSICPECKSNLSVSELEKKLIEDTEKLIAENNRLVGINGEVKVQKVYPVDKNIK